MQPKQKTAVYVIFILFAIVLLGVAPPSADAQCTPTGPEGPFGNATCSDSIDNDCDGDIDAADLDCSDPGVDDDGDGISENIGDCDDGDPTVFPGAPRICDAKDNDCDGRLDFTNDVDDDSDGYAKCAECDDTNSNVNPGVQEGPFGDPSCSDGLDNDCNYLTDDAEESCTNPCVDNDEDGYGNPGAPFCPAGPEDDCNDNDININPGASDNNCNNVDNNCSGTPDDQYVPPITNCGVGECATSGQLLCQAGGVLLDTCAPLAPGIEGPFGDATCADTLDNDCDGNTDGVDADCLNLCADVDSDGYGSNGHATCPNGSAVDCNDNNPAINPGASDADCDSIDEDCSGVADDGYVPTPNNCGVGGCASTGQIECQAGVEVDTCLPGTPAAEGPLGSPTCSDSIDNDCDGDTDAVDFNCQNNCLDIDGDGFGNPGDPSCTGGTAADCDDADPAVYPEAPKICDGKDNNCDGRIDFSTDVDIDSDGYAQCQECNDSNPNVNPGIQEGPFGDPTCSNGIDDDCDFLTDEADPACIDACLDQDSDGYGANGDPACPNGTTIDCNDNNASINPGASDSSCNNIDENCSGTPDDGYVETPTNCGIGACAASGQLECQSGVEVDTCAPSTPGVEGPFSDATCSDSSDNDCDGATDGADNDCIDTCADIDGDGYGSNGHPTCPSGTAIDCNDNDAAINPGASDADCNTIDEDCSGVADDGYVVTPTNCGVGVCAATGQIECQGGSEVNTCLPLPPESSFEDPASTCDDTLDNDCDGVTDANDSDCVDPCIDNDSDGFGANGDPSCPNGSAVDCDDTDSAVYPGAPKICDGKDNNCDGRRDFTTDIDNDSDGHAQCQECDDNNPNVHPGAQEGPPGDSTCSNAIDDDCDFLVDIADPACVNPCLDQDSDGYGANGDPACPNGSAIDCNDNNAAINPGVSDTSCNTIDDNCSGTPDEGYVITPTNCGIGACASTGQLECQNGIEVDTCAPSTPGVEGPVGDPTCVDSIDNDCDAQTDAVDSDCDPAFCNDNDLDGFSPDGGSCGPIDCNDDDPNIRPGAIEACDGIDSDCDPSHPPTEIDQDSDGVLLCAGDCDDTNPNVYPGNIESAFCGGSPVSCSDGLDNDCDFLIDGADSSCTPCEDCDNDGYGANGDPLCAFGPSIDCNDSDPDINPGATEGPPGAPICADTFDNDCDGTVDEGDADCIQTTCSDNDSDGFGSAGHPTCPNGTAIDCDDTDPAVYPGALKICDGKDNNCDGRLDFATDVDNDSDGVPLCGSDCNDNDPGLFPGAIEECTDGIDNDCDLLFDADDPDAVNCPGGNLCPDADGDGYPECDGVCDPQGTACDCDDNSANTRPGADDSNCNSIDENCDGTPDEGYVPTPTSCGVGECAASGQLECQNGVEVDTCISGIPGEESCLAPASCNDGIDNDCDGTVDGSDASCGSCSTCLDNDSDGYGSPGDLSCPNGSLTDCNDNDPTVNPGATEGPGGDPTCTDGLDNDCDGLVDTDGNCSSGTILENGSFENGTQHWTVTAFQNISTFPPHAPTDGTFMMSVTDVYGDLRQMFISPDNLLYLSFDRNLVNPVFSPGPLDAFIFVVRVYDSVGSSVFFKLLSAPAAADLWDAVTVTIPNLISGEQYELKIYVEPNSVSCIPEAPCPPESGKGTVLIDNISLFTSADIDLDGDGYSQNQGDCDDNDPAIFPAADDSNCNNVDEDCTGIPDDSYIPTPTNCGDGVCTASGQLECQSGSEVDTCIPGPQNELTDGTCDGLDGDCDGLTDEDYVITPTNCGQGACSGNTGQVECQGGVEVDTCDPYAGAAGDDSVCNGIDDDCDSLVDEDYVIATTSCGTGICASTGQLECQSGSEIDTCIPGAPQSEGLLDAGTCSDSIDNDCDSKIDLDDEGCLPPPAPHDALDCTVCHITPDTYVIDAAIPNTACQTCHDQNAPGSGSTPTVHTYYETLDDSTSVLPGYVTDAGTGCSLNSSFNNPFYRTLLSDNPSDLCSGGYRYKTSAGGAYSEAIIGPYTETTLVDGISYVVSTQNNGTYSVQLFVLDSTGAEVDTAVETTFAHCAGNNESCTQSIDLSSQSVSVPIDGYLGIRLIAPSNKRLFVGTDYCIAGGGNCAGTLEVTETGTGGGSDLKVATHYSTTYTDPTTGALLDLDCVECHNPMRTQINGRDNTNLQFIRDTLRGSPVAFESYTEANSFADGDAVYDGVCEVCHTQTNYHRNDGSAPGGQSHNNGTDCTLCHAHVDGF